MKREDLFKRNHELFQLFMQQVLESPELRETIPEEANLIFLPDSDSELREANLALADELREKGIKPLFVKVSYVTKRLTVLVPQMEVVETA